MLLNAKPIVERKMNELRMRVEKLVEKPKLVIIRVGNDFASGKYVNNKVKRCDEAGILSEIVHFPEDVESSVVESKILELNQDPETTALLLQLPLPKHLDEDYLTSLIVAEKDVDGFTTLNMGKLVLGQEGNVACTPYGIIELLKAYDIAIEGKDVLIINRSNIVGKPLAHLFLKENATVTVAHSKTRNLEQKVWDADIVVTAVGKANMFSELHFSPYTTIVDVSINFDENGKMCGDVTKSDYDRLVEKHCNITPVPGGVGQMTVSSLIEQAIRIKERE
ncbi:MAG TPA: bifunctional methylenetetrahydrofolate dehydrogenase/methenyltetrahydrofolate cyclohydrolase [Lachnospiraceae bacterium]|nr:bifunctional 5,10-methylenetetrahydrofolate dehydrogenase/5,10-methenyltetrahydrofolate cyclohydrolase [uncultured Lachnoclostridium sp.]HAU85111.1 bifunctional methylenetetrahydrofolate dehydrogenase/methenyltetrahydrofolate cyclohydrolase [Lachnospiraceae bacterium]